jgi:hypothetical protein
MNYTICSGYHPRFGSREFFELWVQNAKENIQNSGHCAIVIGDSGADIPGDRRVIRMSVEGNRGHIGDHIHGRKTGDGFVGWSATVMALALLCYQNETDMVYQEQDCLTFGDCIETMYREIGDGKVIFGKSKAMSCAQSLFLVRYDYLPQFVSDYISVGPDTNSSCLTEDHFKLMLERKPQQWRQFSFGVDRERPEGWIEQRPMYVQQLTPDELALLKERGMI